MDQVQEKEIRWVFIVSILLKGLSALIEFILGSLLLFTGSVSKYIEILVRRELIEDPNDFFASTINHLIPFMVPNTQLLGALYLIAHGIIKVLLVWALLKNKMWAYPVSIIFLSVFILYQLIRFSFTHSILLIMLTMFDLFVLWLVYHEYNHIKKNIGNRTSL